METLINLYNQFAEQVKEIDNKIQNVQREIDQYCSNNSEEIKARITKLEEQIFKIDDYLLRIKGFQELAKKNLDSQNVLTIEAPPGYRVNLNRLRNWAMMIDPMSSNDPYAQRVFVVAKCDEFFLEKKKKEFVERIQELKSNKNGDIDRKVKLLTNSIATLRKELDRVVFGEKAINLFKKITDENKKYWYRFSPIKYNGCNNQNDYISPGAYAVSLPLSKEQKLKLKGILGDYYDSSNSEILLPVEINNRSEYIMTITCAPTRRKKLDKAIQNLILETIDSAPAEKRIIYVIDAVRFNTSSIGSLRQLEDTFVLSHIPRNPEQLTTLLEQIVSSFADTDEIIEQYDSVKEYNETVEPEKRLPQSTIILFGWPTSYDGHDRDLIQKMMTNFERYGISFIIVRYRNEEKNDAIGNNSIPEYAMQNAIHISMLQNQTMITYTDKKPHQFTWYVFSDELSDLYVKSIKENENIVTAIGNEYTKRYSLTELPQYVREYKKIELPFGIDGKDEEHCLSFENENFATYLVGASRSGKSTLLHTLIAGLIRNYHPDNVELWLADFKQLEFKKYISHLPPHVKYVLLDESTELVYDLIDKLTKEMMDRQKLFSRLGIQRIDQVDPTTLERPLPVIFVILDEFSIMSQSIAESTIYKLRLQNILAKGAALGIKFLFSSQTFTTGIAGLTSTARAQIQQRIAMKGSKEEISQTLELSANNKTDQVKNWMDALPPHYALVKFRTGIDTLPQVKRYLVMYFKDYTPRDQMIDRIRTSMVSIDNYNPRDINTYTNKHPVLVDGNTFEAFDEVELSNYRELVLKANKSDFSGDEVLVSFGTPRLMERVKLAIVSSETRENILLISSIVEQACAASIIISSIKSFIKQNSKVQIWAYEKNRLFRAYRSIFKEYRIEFVTGMDDICAEISSLKRELIEGKFEKKLIVLIGIDRICLDFDYITSESSISNENIDTIDKARVKTEDDQKRLDIFNSFNKMWGAIESKLVEDGKSKDEIIRIKKERRKQYVEENYIKKIELNKKVNPSKNLVFEKKSANKKAYNAKEDFNFIVKQGSKLGRHFLLSLNSFADLKSTGLRLEYFRYKMSFQVSIDDSRILFRNKIGSTLPEHICQFNDTIESYSFRPYLHEGIEWDGWFVKNGKVNNPYENLE